jgi:alpha-glucosidase (family GH31 glycosyl hydrolase)
MQMKHFFDEGADFIKLDRTSDINTCKAMFEITQESGKETKGRGFILSHTGGTSFESFKKYPTKWTDDTRSDWTIETPTKAFDSWVPAVALKENIAMYTDSRLETSKIPFLTNDLGGFDIGKPQVVSEELYIRWLQFSMFCPITEVFSQPENPTSNLAWLYSARADSIFRFYSHLRLRLFPYLYSYAQQSRLTGQAMLRQIPGQLYEFLLGNELLVAPVYEKGAISRKVFLPVGKWINYWTGQVLDGGSEIEVPAPLNYIPLFVKAGSVIPMRMYSSSVESGNNNSLLLDVYPQGNSTFSLLEDDGTSNDYVNGIYATTAIDIHKSGKKISITIAPVKGGFEEMKPERNWILKTHCPKKPVKVIFNSRVINYEFDAGNNLVSFQSGYYQKDKPLSFVITLP